MPRQESLSAITPNRYYRLQATLKFKHQTEYFTTAIIEEDSVQRKIKLPLEAHDLIEGAKYDFAKCFFSSNGWIRVKETQGISQLEPKSIETNSLPEIFENRYKLNNNCLSLVLEIVDIKKPEKKMKDGKELNLIQMRGFADERLVDITLWNREAPEDILGKKVFLEGVRLKMLTDSSIVLVSTVYTKFTELEEQSVSYRPNIKYEDLSDLYTTKSIVQIEEDLSLLKFSHSIVTCTIKECEIFNYEGCVDCHKKLEDENCTFCHKPANKGKFDIIQLLLEDESGMIEVFAFDKSVQGVLAYCKKGSNMTARVKSTIRQQAGDEITSHILSSIQSINF
jgi:hypothetical protein